MLSDLSNYKTNHAIHDATNHIMNIKMCVFELKRKSFSKYVFINFILIYKLRNMISSNNKISMIRITNKLLF